MARPPVDFWFQIQNDKAVYNLPSDHPAPAPPRAQMKALPSESTKYSRYAGIKIRSPVVNTTNTQSEYHT